MLGVGSSRLEFRLFGSFDARLDGQPLPGLENNRRAAHLLAFLALNSHRMLTREWVAEQLSDVDPGGNRVEFSVNNLSQQLIILRQMLGGAASALASDRGPISLGGDSVSVDTCEFNRIWEARAQDPGGLKRLVDLYQGPLLQDWNAAWIRARRDVFARKYLQSLRALGRQAGEDGDIEAAIDYLARAVEIDPASQQTQIQLIETLLNAGEFLKAKQTLQRYADILREQGLPLSNEMIDLFDRIPHSIPGAVSVSNASVLEVEPAGGGVPIRSRYYIVRAADAECHEAIARRDSFVLLQGSRQVGKTSILARGLEQARRMGSTVLHTDLQKFSEKEIASLESFFWSLALRLSRSLHLPASSRSSWDIELTPGMNFEQFFLENVLERTTGPVVWGIDEVDLIFACDYRGDVFSLFRSWHNERALSPGSPVNRLTILLSYAIEANQFIPNLNQSPFNVGSNVSLSDFSLQQVKDLCGLHDVPPEDADALFRLTDGHPYLMRSALYTIKTGKMTLNDLEARAGREDGPFGGHLHHLKKTLSTHAALLRVVKGVLEGEACPSSEAYYHLIAAGILKGDAPEAVRLRCPVYEAYLRKSLP